MISPSPLCCRRDEGNQRLGVLFFFLIGHTKGDQNRAMIIFRVTARQDLPTAMIPSAYSIFKVFQPGERVQDLLGRSSPPLSALCVVSGSLTTTLAGQLPRRERWLLLLLDGKCTLVDLARLTQRSELDVATMLARFLQWGYIEPMNVEEYTTRQFESEYNSA
jgi:hypothetical protein